MRYSPHRAIFQRKPRHGAPNVGATIGVPWVPPAPDPLPLIYVTSAGVSSGGLAVVEFDGATLSIIGFLDASTWGGDNPRSVKVQGDYAYITDFSLRSFVVADISDPTNPTFVTQITDNTNWNQLWGLDVVGNYAYVAARSSDRVSIIDITNPLSPSVVGFVTHATNLNGANEIRVVGNYAYVTGYTQSDSVYVVDVTTKTAPAIIGSVTHASLLDAPFGIEVIGNVGYVIASFSDSLTTLDVTTPATPTISSAVSGGIAMDEPNRLVIVGNYAYVAASQSASALAIVNITVPSAPTFVTGRSGPAAAFGIAHANGYVFMSDFGDNKLYAYHITNPENPVLITSIQDALIEDAGDIDVVGGTVTVALPVETWTAQTAATAFAYTDVCWSPALGLYAATAQASGGSNQGVMTSPDGINWTGRAVATNILLNCICWSPDLGMFFATGNTSTTGYSSTDGITWTPRTQPTGPWFSVTWSSALGLFCAVRSGNSMTSPDGITWTNHVDADLNQAESVAWSPSLGLFVTVASTGTSGQRAASSPDGVTWTVRSTPGGTSTWQAVCWSPDRAMFVAAANGGSARIMTSTNGTSWTSRSSSFSADGYAVAWSPGRGRFVSMSATLSPRAEGSPDGINWSPQTAPVKQWRGVTWSPALSQFVAVGLSGGVATSP